ncbi:WD repeat-containing protein-like protein [Zea mays]|uniref:WD repeat-containing protein-like protein n=1 Tax=Zea mays TaxID=4577 RepID=A0A1D6Q914_MAIZE|nr:WD repeat-containing protein-like protein [Zea mays]
MAYQFNSPIISRILNIFLILVDWYQYNCPLARHLVQPEDMVEQLGYPYYIIVLEASPCLNWDTIRAHLLTPFHSFQCLFNLRIAYWCHQKSHPRLSSFSPLNNFSKYSCINA